MGWRAELTDDQKRVATRVVANRERRTEAYLGVPARARRHLLEESAVTPTESSVVVSELVPDRAVLSVLRRVSPADMDTVVIAEVARLAPQRPARC